MIDLLGFAVAASGDRVRENSEVSVILRWNACFSVCCFGEKAALQRFPMQSSSCMSFHSLPAKFCRMALNVASVGLTVWNTDVYEPSDDSFTLVDALELCAAEWKDQPPRTCVEIGCGSGYVICSLALMLKQLQINSVMLATDVSTAALKATRQTLDNHGVHHVELVHTDLLNGVMHKLGHNIDILVSRALITWPRIPDAKVYRCSTSATDSAAVSCSCSDRVLPALSLPMTPDALVTSSTALPPALAAF